MKHAKKVGKKVANLMTRCGVTTYADTQQVIKEARSRMGLKAPRAKNGSVKRLSLSELEEVLECAHRVSAQHRLIFETLYYTGARVAEFCDLTAQDFYAGEARVVIADGKGGKRREVPIPSWLASKIEIYLQDRTEGPLFQNSHGTKLQVRTVQFWVKDLRRQLNLSIHLTPHSFRHSIATHMVERGFTKDMVQAFLGHSRSDTTEIYTRTANPGLAAKVREVYG